MKNPITQLIIAVFFLSILNHQVISQELPIPGQLIITEFMSNPSAVSDSKGEWFEVFNTSDKTLLLNGMIISDNGSNSHTINSDQDILIGPGVYLIFARSEETSENGGISSDYIYSNFTLGNSEDEIVISLPDETVIDQITYTADWPLYSGASCELSPAFDFSLENNDWQHWHPAVDTYGQGDLGTPGKENSISSFIYMLDKLEEFEVFPNPTTGPLFVRIRTMEAEEVKISLINVLGQRIPLFEQRVAGSLFIPLTLDQIDIGIYWLEVCPGETRSWQKIIHQ